MTHLRVDSPVRPAYETQPILTKEALTRWHTENLKLTLLLFDEVEKASESLWQLLLAGYRGVCSVWAGFLCTSPGGVGFRLNLEPRGLRQSEPAIGCQRGSRDVASLVGAQKD